MANLKEAFDNVERNLDAEKVLIQTLRAILKLTEPGSPPQESYIALKHRVAEIARQGMEQALRFQKGQV